MFNIKVEEVYNKLLSNKEIINIYDKIGEKEISQNDMAFHNYDHIMNVMNIATKILTDLNFNQNTIFKVRIACLLHDVGALQGKKDHTERSYQFAKQYFKKNDWQFDGKEEILDAIKNHSAGFETNNILTLSLVLADKLDIKSTRITEAGKKVIGNRQYQHINDIKINIENNLFVINFITDGNMDVDEVNSYYFTEKVFKAVAAFSNKLDLDYKILLDDKTWNINKGEIK